MGFSTSESKSVYSQDVINWSTSINPCKIVHCEFYSCQICYDVYARVRDKSDKRWLN